MLATMWPVYSGDQYRDALAQWDAGQPDPDDWRTASNRRTCLDAEALAVADVVTAEQQSLRTPLPVLILAGAGGNGRAGLRVGIVLLRRGYRVEVALFPNPRPTDDPDMYPNSYEDAEALWREDVTDESQDLLRDFLACDGQITQRRTEEEAWSQCLGVDAICGRGIDGRLRGPLTAWASCFVSHPPVVAIDQPTGMDPDTGITVPASENAAPAVGGFTAKNTVVVGGLRPVHLLQDDCGRLVFVRGGIHWHLDRSADARRQAADATDPAYFDDHGHVPVRDRSGYLAQDLWQDGAGTVRPRFTAYADPYADRDTAEDPRTRWALQLPGTLEDITWDRPFAEAVGGLSMHPRRVPASVGVAGAPDRRPGAPELVALGAVACAGWDILADEDAVRRVSTAVPEVEIATVASADRPWVQCAGTTAVDLSAVRTLILTRDAVRDVVDAGGSPPASGADRHVVLVVDQASAVSALAVWGGQDGGCEGDIEGVQQWTDDSGPVTLAELLASCTGAEVILVDTVIVRVRGFSTDIIRTGTRQSAAGFADVLAGLVAADISDQEVSGVVGRQVHHRFSPLVSFLVLARSIPRERDAPEWHGSGRSAKREPDRAPTAREVVAALPREWSALRSAAVSAGDAWLG